MRKVSLFLGITALAALSQAATVSVFLTGGQSNTEGRIENSQLPEYLQSNEYALASVHGSVNDETTLGTFEAFAPTGKWAYDAEVYYRIGQALKSQFYVIKTSYGGTSVHPGVGNSPSSHLNAWLPGYGAGYHWSADPTFLAATVSAGRTFVQDETTYDGQSMLKAWIENIDAALDAIIANGDTPEVKAIIWHQGESDKNIGTYATILTDMVTYVRNHLSTKLGGDYSALPFFCGSIPRKSSLYTANIDRAFQTIEETEDNNMHVVDIYDLTMLSDTKHFDAPSAILFGQRLYNRMVDEGVITGTKVDVADCVRAPEFGIEHVVNNTTTWKWDEASGDVATSLTDVNGMYFHGQNTNSRKFQVTSSYSHTITWTIGTEESFTTKKGAYSNWYDYGGNLTSTTTAGENSSKLYNTVGVNVGRSGKFEAFVVTGGTGTAKLYCNGKLVDSATSEVKGTLLHIKGSNEVASVYYIIAPGSSSLFGARFVPDEEMPEVSLEIGESGWGTFGNRYESNFALPDGVKAYTIGTVEGYPSLLSMNEVGAINIGDAVVVQGEAGSYTLEPGTGVSSSAENLLVVQNETGNLESTSGDDFFNFAQSVDAEGKLIFTRADGTQTLEAGNAFFSITEGDEHALEQTLNVRNTGDTSKFSWSGKGADSLWTTTNNWAWADGEPPLNLPQSGATCTFDNEASVTFNNNFNAEGYGIVLNADVTIASDDGKTERTITQPSFSGTGTLILGNKIKIQTKSYSACTINNDIRIADDANVTFHSYGNGAKFTLNGALCGGGDVTLSNRNGGGSVTVNSDMSGFTGTLDIGGTGTIKINGATGDDGVAIKASDAETAAAKVSLPSRPSGVTDAMVSTTDYQAYFKRNAVEKEGMSGYYVVTVALDETAVAVDETLESIDTAALADATSASLALSNAKPGLYYSVVGGTAVDEINVEGTRTLATSDTVSPAKPALAGDGKSAFYCINVSASAK